MSDITVMESDGGKSGCRENRENHFLIRTDIHDEVD